MYAIGMFTHRREAEFNRFIDENSLTDAENRTIANATDDVVRAIQPFVGDRQCVDRVFKGMKNEGEGR